MELKVGIQNAMKEALRRGDRVTLSTLRLLLSALHNEEIKGRRELTQEETLRVISTLCKQRQESIEYFRKGGRNDLMENETAELEVLRRLFPPALTEDEVRAVIRGAMSESGAEGPKDLGRVMKQVMLRVTGRMDGKRVTELAKELLGA
jgi:uncharacterized protein